MIELLIIGAGPTGIACGIEAQKSGIPFLILEKGALVDSIYHFPTNMTFFSTSQLLEIGDIPFIAHGDKPTRREALEYYRRVMEHYRLPIRNYEEVSELVKKTEGFEVRTVKGVYQARNIVLATGYFGLPKLLHVPGEQLEKVKHYYDDAHPYIGKEVLVIGAANSACDVALETYYKGAKVSMAIRESEIYPKVKYWIRPNIENRIKEGSIKAFFNTTVVAIRDHEVDLIQEGEQITISNDFVLAMTGYQPDYAFLSACGVTFHNDLYKTPEYDEASLESRVPGLYIAGVICGGLHTSKFFIENTREHGKKIVKHILSTTPGLRE